jgi:prepilin-type N-terminal cleavage/methylation domain-containing protein
MLGVRKAFTLVELLVVIAIIAILVLLTLPAVNAVREAARMNACKNNARQTGLALHAFHTAERQLPSGWIVEGDNHHEHEHDAHEGDPGWGWATMILPFVEEESLYENTLHLDLPIEDPANQKGRETIVSIFQCPSDGSDYRFMLHEGEEHHHEEHEHEHEEDEHEHEEEGPEMFEVARSNYAGIFGSHDAFETPDDADGLFFQNSRVRFGQIKDGLSKTFLVGERSSRVGGTTWVGRVPGASDAMARVVGLSCTPPNSDVNHLHDFSSHHPNGAHFVMADGAVQLIDDRIDMEVYRAMFTRAGAEFLDGSE